MEIRGRNRKAHQIKEVENCQEIPLLHQLWFAVRGSMNQKQADDCVFCLSRSSYQRPRLIAWLLIAASLGAALVCAVLAVRLWPTYLHIFTPYLKWQDAILATLLYITLLLLAGVILVVRFLYALRAGYRHIMFILQRGSSLTVRYLSPNN